MCESSDEDMAGAGVGFAGVGGIVGGIGVPEGAFRELTEDARARSRSAAAVLATEIAVGTPRTWCLYGEE